MLTAVLETGLLTRTMAVPKHSPAYPAAAAMPSILLAHAGNELEDASRSQHQIDHICSAAKPGTATYTSRGCV